MKTTTLFQTILAAIVIANPITARSSPTVANGNFEHNHLAPAWTRFIAGNASIIKTPDPSNSANHVARIALNCDPCHCNDDNCCSASLAGKIRNLVPGANYSISWAFMYARDVDDVFWFADAARCDVGGCQVSSFENVVYPASATRRIWYSYRASFVAPVNVDEGPLELDVFPGGCATGHTYVDNFLVSGPL